MKTHIQLTFMLLIATVACKRSLPKIEAPVNLQLQSPSFRSGDTIPKQFTCDGPNISPALTWSAPPDNTQTLAISLSDPDAPGGTFTHWILYNLPPQTRSLAEGVPTQAQLPDGSKQARNDNDSTGYWGPCPPAGSRHRYNFVLFAFDSKFTLPANVDLRQLDTAAKGHLLGTSRLMGFYQR